MPISKVGLVSNESAVRDEAGVGLDGRSRRSDRSRQLVVETFLDLLVEGEPQPTAMQVSERCGVSMRSIFRLFDDVEAMHAAAVATQIDRVAHLVVALEPTGSLDRRIKAVVEGRSRLFEAISPVRRMAVRLAPTSRPISADLKLANEFFRAQLAEMFAVELTVLSPARRATMLDTLDLATSWETWERLRGIQLVPQRRARRIVSDLVRQILIAANPVPTSTTGARS